MPESRHAGAARIYLVAREFFDRCLFSGDSLFTPGMPIWSREVLDDFRGRFIDEALTDESSFEDKLERQLEDADPETVQLAAELLYFDLLVPGSMKAETKRGKVEAVLSWSPRPVNIPGPLSEALEGGVVGNPGTAFFTLRYWQLRMLVDLAERLRRMSTEERQRIHDDPSRWRTFVKSASGKGTGPMEEVLLHLRFPDRFEPTLVAKHKEQIAAAFAQHVRSREADIDTQVAEIRGALEPELGSGFSFYEGAVLPRWKPIPKTVGDLDRTDPVLAQRIVEALIPDPRTRRSVLDYLADAIDLAGHRPEAWGVTLAPDFLNMNVGWLYLLRVRKTGLRFLVRSRHLSDPLRERLSSAREAGAGYEDAPDLDFYSVTHAEFASVMNELRGATGPTVDYLLSQKKGRLLWWDSFSPGVLEYLEAELGRELPFPDYSQGSGVQRYWKIAPGRQAWQWEECRAGGFIGIGWPNFGDLRELASREEFEARRKRLDTEDPTESYSKQGISQLWAFSRIAPGDRIVANKGQKKILGVGTVTSGYHFEVSDREHPHRLGVRWDDTTTRDVDEKSWLVTVRELGKSKFAQLVGESDGEAGEESETPSGSVPVEDRPVFERILESLEAAGLYFAPDLVADFLLALQAKRFVVLSGISGTGKTQLAMAVAAAFRTTNSVRRHGELPSEAVSVQVFPYMVNGGRIVLPREFTQTMPPLVLGPSNSTRVRVRYDDRETDLNLWRDVARDVSVLTFRGSFKQWFRDHFSVGDPLWIHDESEDEGAEAVLRFSKPVVEQVEISVDNARVIPVRPDWTDHRGLLGFFNPLTATYERTPFLDLLLRAGAEEGVARTEERDPTPFFAILDEMNLARVEHYFADFLSALESRQPLELHDSPELESGETNAGVVIPRTLRIPDNVFFVGTVNVDESTYMFSPKVLDRAFTLELNEVDLGGLADAEVDGVGDLRLVHLPGSLRWSGPIRSDDWKELWRDHRDAAERVREIHEILESENRHFGYRVANEIARFVLLAVRQADRDVDAAAAALDLAVLHKVLPKLHGTQQELERILDLLFVFAVTGESLASSPAEAEAWTTREWRVQRGGKIAPGGLPRAGVSSTGSEDENDDDLPLPLPRVAAKLHRMRQRLLHHGFTSFIE